MALDLIRWGLLPSWAKDQKIAWKPAQAPLMPQLRNGGEQINSTPSGDRCAGQDVWNGPSPAPPSAAGSAWSGLNIAMIARAGKGEGPV